MSHTGHALAGTPLQRNRLLESKQLTVIADRLQGSGGSPPAVAQLRALVLDRVDLKGAIYEHVAGLSQVTRPRLDTATLPCVPPSVLDLVSSRTVPTGNLTRLNRLCLGAAAADDDRPQHQQRPQTQRRRAAKLPGWHASCGLVSSNKRRTIPGLAAPAPSRRREQLLLPGRSVPAEVNASALPTVHCNERGLPNVTSFPPGQIWPFGHLAI